MQPLTDEWLPRYAPFIPDAPLPPAITPALVQRVYRDHHVSVHDVLKLAGIQGPSDRAARILRERLDDGDFRKRLSRLKVQNEMYLDFRGILQSWCTISNPGFELLPALRLGYEFSLDEYRSRVEAAKAEGRNTCPVLPREYLNTIERTKDRFEAQHLGRSTRESTPLPPGLHAEIAWNNFKRQMRSRPDLVRLNPLERHRLGRDGTWGLGECLALYYMCQIWKYPDEDVEYVWDFLEPDERLYSLLGLVRAAAAPVARGQSSVFEIAMPVASPEETPVSPDLQCPVAGSTVRPTETPPPPAPPSSPGSGDGPRSRRRSEAHLALTQARAHRKQLAGADILDRAAFEVAADAELEALDRLRTIETSLAVELSQVVARYVHARSPLLPRIDLKAPADASPAASARWLDAQLPRLEAFQALSDAFEARLEALAALSPADPQPAPAASDPVGIDEATASLRAQIAGLEASIQRVHTWRERCASLVRRLDGCAGPAFASVIDRVDRDDLILMLDQAHRDRRWRGLVPMLIRALLELEGLESEVLEPDVVACLERAVADAEGNGRPEDLRDLLALLPLEMLQRMLRSGNRELARHVLLSGLRDALGRRHPVFFASLWACPGWSGRARCVGERVADVLEALQRVFLRESSMESVLSALQQAGAATRGPASSAGGRTATVATDDGATHADPLIQALTRSLQRLHRRAGEQEAHWLERRIAALLSPTTTRDLPAAFLGELPSPRTLFAAGRTSTSTATTPSVTGAPETMRSSRTHSGAGRMSASATTTPSITAPPDESTARWPSWIEASPASERLWMLRDADRCGWQDLLQEGIVHFLLERRRSPGEVMESLFAARELEAMMDASSWPGFAGDLEVQTMVAHVQKLELRTRLARTRIEALSRRVEALPRPVAGAGNLARAVDLEGPLLEAMEALDAEALDEAEQKLAEVGLALVGGSLSLLCTTAWRDAEPVLKAARRGTTATAAQPAVPVRRSHPAHSRVATSRS